MKEFIVSGKKVFVWERILSPEVCETWIKNIRVILSSKEGGNEVFANGFYDTVTKTIGELPVAVQRHRPEITIGYSLLPIIEHYDKKIGTEQWKLFAYLNEIKNGGTDFYDTEKQAWITIENSPGTVILFDTDLFHRGQRGQERRKKYTVGVRLE